MRFANQLLIGGAALIIGIGAISGCKSVAETAVTNKAAGGTEQSKTNANKKNASNIATNNSGSGANKNKSVESVLGECTLTKAPIIKGFTLGETVEEIDRQFPGFKAAYDDEKEKSSASNKKANFVLITSGSQLLQNTKVNDKEYADTTLIWHFLDEKLMGLVVEDTSEASPDLSIMEFLSDAAVKYNLPKEGWKIGKENDADITCQGFEVSLTAGGQPGMSVMMTDTQAEKERQKRQS